VFVIVFACLKGEGSLKGRHSQIEKILIYLETFFESFNYQFKHFYLKVLVRYDITSSPHSMYKKYKGLKERSIFENF